MGRLNAYDTQIIFKFLLENIDKYQVENQHQVLFGIEGRIIDSRREPAYQNYKELCEDSFKDKPPPNLDQCDQAKWRLNALKNCISLRQAWDDEFDPGRHHKEISAQLNRIKKFEKAVVKACRL